MLETSLLAYPSILDDLQVFDMLMVKTQKRLVYRTLLDLHIRRQGWGTCGPR